ncbi:MAG: response regulator [Deltaproteobacteria bacterium]|nr:response regulator [Deltaproteobacteria bacterium]
MKNILIIDDNQSILDIISAKLKNCDEPINVKTALNGKLALEILHTSKIDLVITDLDMPEMDGFELLSYMNKHFNDIPALVMTGLDSPEHKTRLARVGIFNFIEKPFDINLLQSEILNILHNRNKGHLNSVSLPNLLQTIEMDEKTLTLRIVSHEKFGYMHFDKGLLIDAETDNLIGEDAAVEILGWDEAEIKFQDLITRENKIHVSLMNIILEASRNKDESCHHNRETDRLVDETVDQDKSANDTLRTAQLLDKAIDLAEGRHFKAALKTLTEFLKLNPRNHMGWIWYSRLISNLKVVHSALKNARLIAPNDPIVITETEKNNIAGDLSNAEKIHRCPFCWCPMDIKNLKCRYCQTYRHFNEQIFTTPKSPNNKILTQAVSRYVKVIDREENPMAHFYLGMAYLNLGQWEKGLDHLHKTVKLAPSIPIYSDQLRKLMAHLASRKSTCEDQNNKKETESTSDDDTLVGRSKNKILVVEDSPTTRKIITITLSQNGYDAIEARDGLEALSRLNEASPDLILLDIILPKMDGYKVLSIIKESPEFKDIPVIMLTSKDGFLNKAKGKFSGSNAYLTKPFDPGVLIETIEKHL